MGCLYNYKGKEYTEKELLEVLKSDPRIMEEYYPQQQKISEGSDYLKEELEVFQEKVDFLQKKMNVEVILDSSVETSRVLPASDQRVKDAGKPVILINPSAIFKTTAIHEFAHIFVDALPDGNKNKRFRRAVEMLQGTDLYYEIKALYPELSEEMFEKELVVTAIGRKGAEIWDTEGELGVWESFKKWFLQQINSIFGLNTDAILSLTEEILSDKTRPVNARIDTLSSIAQEERVATKEEVQDNKDTEELSRTEKVLNKLYKETLTTVTNIYNEYRPKSVEAQIAEAQSQEQSTTRFSRVGALKYQLDLLDATQQKTGLISYIKWVENEIDFVNKVVSNRINKGTMTPDKIMGSIEWNEGFQMIDQMQNLLKELVDDKAISKAEERLFNRKLKSIQRKRADLVEELNHQAKKVYADFMAKNNNKYQNIAKEKYSKEYDDNAIAETGKSRQQYIIERLSEENEILYQQAYEDALDKANTSVSDITKLAATMWSEKNAKSDDVQVLSTLVDAVEAKIGEYSVSEANVMYENNQKYKEEVSGALNQKEKYAGLYTISESGKVYFASKYKPEWLEKRKELIRGYADPDTAQKMYGDIKVEGDLVEYTIDGVKKKLRFGEGTKWKVETNSKGESIHVSYELLGDRHHVPTAEAIGMAEYEEWLDKNTEQVKSYGKVYSVPTSNWIDKNYEALSNAQDTNSKNKMKYLEYLKKKIKDADENYGGEGSLITRAYGQEFIRLPGMLKTDAQRLLEGNVKGLLKHKISEITMTQADDFETETGTGVKAGDSFKRVFASISNREKGRIPIPFRAVLDQNEQSFDLHTLVLANSIASKNYAEKKKIENTFLTVLEVMKNRQVPDKAGIRQLQKVHALDKDVPPQSLYKDPRNGIPNDARRALDTLETRIYGIKSKDAGTIKVAGKEVDLNQATKAWLKYSGMTALVGNLINSVVNLNTGTINNLVEAMGGEHFTMSDWWYAGKVYWTDSKRIISDWGKTVDTSRTNLFLNAWNVMGDKQVTEGGFEESTRFQTLFKMNSLRPIAKAGEHMMQAKVMYAVMRNIRVMNEQGKWIDKDGKVVSEKKQAASLNEMIEFIPNEKDGSIQMKLDPRVASTTFSLTGGRDQIMLETRNLIKYKIRELHGNYDSDIQAAAQKEFWGKAAYFLRKWIEDGYFRRWRGAGKVWTKNEDISDADKFYAQEAKGFREGYYVTSLRFFRRNIIPGIAQVNMTLMKEGYKNLDAGQKANLRKITAELMLVSLVLLAYMAMGDDDDDIVYKYLFRRQLAEVSFFMSPTEAIKIVSTPTASIGTFKRLTKIMTQMFDPFEEFETGKHKGRNKLWVNMLKAFPITSQKEKDIKASLDFLNTVSLVN